MTDHFIRELPARFADLAPEVRPAFHRVITDERAAQKRPDRARKFEMVIDRDRTGVLVDFIEEKPF